MNKKHILSISDAEIYSVDKIAKVDKMAEEKINKSVYYNKSAQQYVIAELVENIIKIFVYRIIDGNTVIQFIHMNNGEKMYTRYFSEERVTTSGYQKNLENTNMLPEDIKKVCKWLNVEDCDDKYSRYLLEDIPKIVNDKKREARINKELAENKEMFSTLKPLPKSWQNFLDNQVMPEQYGFFNHKEKEVRTTCCKSDFSYKELPKFKEKDEIRCPKCNKRLIMKSVNRKAPYHNRTACLFDKTKDGDICVRYFDVVYNYFYYGIEKHFREVVRTVWKGEEIYYEPYEYSENWKKYTPSYSYWGNRCGRHYEFCSESIVFLRNVSALLKGTKYEYSGYERLKSYYNKDFCGYFLEGYLKGLKNKPYIEQLAKAGYQNVVFQLYKGNISAYSLNSNGTKPHEILKVNKGYMKEFRRDFKPELLSVYQIATAENVCIDRKKAEYIARYFNNRERRVLKYSLDTLKKMKTYIETQIDTNYDYTMSDYFDYLKLVNLLGCKEKRYRYPDDLKMAHDQANELYKLHKQELNKQVFIKRAEELKDFAFETKNYAFLVPTSPEDFIKESDALHHCLARCYTDQYADGDTNIVFIRDKKNIEKPLATMEFFNGKVKQVRAINNSIPAQPILDAVEKFKQIKFAVA